MNRRKFITTAAALPLAGGLPSLARAQARQFTPGAAGWRTFEIVTQVDVANAAGVTRVWVPVPAIDTDWQQSLPSTFTGSTRDVAMESERKYGAKMVRATFADGEKQPTLTVVSRIRTRDRNMDWAKKTRPAAPADLAQSLAPTELIPTDGF